MLNLHLFFVKQFGCKICEGNIPIPLKPLSDAILNTKPHPNIFIAVCPPFPGEIGPTDVSTHNISTKKTVIAVWHYGLLEFSIRIIYADPILKYPELQDSWHPLTIGKTIKIA